MHLRALTIAVHIDTLPVLREVAWSVAWDGDVAALTALLDASAPLSCVDYGRPPLHAACSKGRVACMALLLDRGADASAPDSCGDTPVRCCLREKHTACLDLLLERGSCFGPRDCGGFLPAAEYGDVALMEELLRRGEDPRPVIVVPPLDVGYPSIRPAELRKREAEALLSFTCSTPLHAACSNGHAAAVAWLCRHGASVHVVDGKGRTPLHVACMQGKRDCAEVLLLHGADPDDADHNGFTPLLRALIGGCYGCVSLLLDHGAMATPPVAPSAAADSFDVDMELFWRMCFRLSAHVTTVSAACEHRMAMARFCARP